MEMTASAWGHRVAVWLCMPLFVAIGVSLVIL